MADPAAKPSLSVVILTMDEEENLPHTLTSIAGLADEVFIVDSGSKDRTCEVAESMGAKVVFHAFVNQAEQFNWAMDNLPITSAWTMRLDADERLTPELVEELRRKLPTTPPDITGYRMKRRVYFWGKWVRFGGYYPTWLLRVWRTGAGRSENLRMDEHIVLSHGQEAELEHDFIDENRKDLTFWTEKHNSYSNREVRAILAAREGRAASANLSGQAARRRWLKGNIYENAPLFLRAGVYWFFRYVFLLGFLDGRHGLVFHFLQGFWYRMLVDAKLWEAERRKRPAP